MPRVAVAGDLHGSESWLRNVMRTVRSEAPDVTTILQLGDWWMDLDASDELASEFDIERVGVVPGNHDPYPAFQHLLDAHPGKAVQVSKSTWIFPRPFRIRGMGRDILAFGGATSVDRYWRTPAEWFPEETITDEQVAAAIAGGPADIMLTHESPAKSPVKAVRQILRTNPHGFPRESIIESAASRVRLGKVWDAVRPDLLCNGHMHAPGAGQTEDGRRVISFGCNEQEGSLGILDLRDLSVEFPSLKTIRGW
ncbi:metallophosphoesterase [Microbacterium sp. NPDC091382]|uniref:metallophosphoesterase family protein n=1 Tax=Microbacterium sp. NPDC091382 TaxID=3364210 RepID=UPI00381FB8B4